jgi:hypothetical protein
LKKLQANPNNKEIKSRVLVAHTCNLSYLGG